MEGAEKKELGTDEACQNRLHGVQELECSSSYIQGWDPLAGTQALDKSAKYTQHHESKSSLGKLSEEERSFLCPYCQYKNTNSHHVRSHILTKHAGEKPFFCPYCKYRCQQGKTLKLHINLKHPHKKPYACSLCNYRSSQSNNLSRHLHLKHSPTKIRSKPVKRKPLLCPLCDYRCSQVGNIKSHIRFKHSKVKPHACAFCKHRSSQSKNLRRHVASKHSKQKQTRISSNDKKETIKTNKKITGPEDISSNNYNLQCFNYISQASSGKNIEDPVDELSNNASQDDQQRSIKQPSKGSDLNSILIDRNIDDDVTPENSTDTNIVVEQVLSLSHRSSQPGNLKSHISFKHSKVKPYSCPYCSYRSSLSSNVNRHVKLKHFDILTSSNQGSPLATPQSGNKSEFNNNKNVELFLHEECIMSDPSDNSQLDSVKAVPFDVRGSNETQIDIDSKHRNITEVNNTNTCNQLPYSVQNHTFAERKFQCPHCDHRCSQSGNLMSHIAFKHSKIKPFRCPYCSYGSYFSGNVNRHVRLKHFHLAFETIRSAVDSTMPNDFIPLSNQANPDSSLPEEANVNDRSTELEDSVNVGPSEANLSINFITESSFIRSPTPKIKTKNSDEQGIYLPNNNSRGFSLDDSSSAPSFVNSENTSTICSALNVNLKEPQLASCKEVGSDHSLSFPQRDIIGLKDSTNSKIQLWIKNNDNQNNDTKSHQNRNFQCPYCEHRSTLSGNLKSHIAFKHSKIKPFRCPHCSYGSYLSGNVNRHIKLKHFDIGSVASNVSKIRDEIVDDASWNLTGYENSLTITFTPNGIKSRNNIENRVSSSLIDKANFNEENGKSTANSFGSKKQAEIGIIEQPSSCDNKPEGSLNDCKLANQKSDELVPVRTNHQEKSTGPSSPQIKLEPHCDQENDVEVDSSVESSSRHSSFKSEDSSLDMSRKEITHKYSHSRNVDLIDTHEHLWTNNKELTKTDNQIRNFQCPYCDHRSTLSGNLKSHIAFKHSKIKPHRCPYCEYDSYLSSNVTRHVKIKHSDVGTILNNITKNQYEETGNSNSEFIVGSKDIPVLTLEQNESHSTNNIQCQHSLCAPNPNDEPNVPSKSETSVNIKRRFPDPPVEIHLTEDTSCDEDQSSVESKQPRTNSIEHPLKGTQHSFDNASLNDCHLINQESDGNNSIDLTSQPHLPSDTIANIKHENKECCTTETKSEVSSFNDHYSLSSFVESENSSTNYSDFNENLNEQFDAHRSERTQDDSVSFRPNGINVSFDPRNSKLLSWPSSNDSTRNGSKRGFQCPYCDHRSTLSGNLKSHIAFKHSKIKPHRCPYCEYGSYLSSNVTRHVKIKHSAVGPLSANTAEMQNHTIDNSGFLGIPSPLNPVDPGDVQNGLVKAEDPLNMTECFSDTKTGINFVQDVSSCGVDHRRMETKNLGMNFEKSLPNKLELFDIVPENKSQLITSNSEENMFMQSPNVTLAEHSHSTYTSSSCDTIKSEYTKESANPHGELNNGSAFHNHNQVDYSDLPTLENKNHLSYEENLLFNSSPSGYDLGESPHTSVAHNEAKTEEMNHIKVETHSQIFSEKMPAQQNGSQNCDFLDAAVNFQDKPYHCPYCEYHCSQSSNLKVHIACRHLKVKPFRCFYCNYSSSQSSNVRRHLRFKHPNASSQSAILKEKISPPNCNDARLNPKSDFPYDESNYNFNSSHSNSCDSRGPGEFPTSQDIYSEVPEVTVQNQGIQYTPGEYESSSGNICLGQHFPTKTISEPMKITKRVYECPYCEHKTSQSSNLKSHIASRHSNVKPYICSYCDYRSSQSSNFKRHLRLRHSIDQVPKSRFQPPHFQSHLLNVSW